MKKILAFVAAAVCSMAAWATNYQGELIVSVNGESAAMDAGIIIVKSEAGYNLSIKNFKLGAEGIYLPIGNIELNGCAGTDAFGITTINFNDKTVITPGDDPAYATEEWMGPALGEVPIVMTAKLNDQVLSVSIDIDMMATIQQVIAVNFVGSAPAGDINGDGDINVSDVTTLINKILQ
ncbi:MAG: calycin-like domain-containing protein [Bacteroidales bacterium]|nr:calycin-like domain-containing protein [Bacteroidales bacterium]